MTRTLSRGWIDLAAMLAGAPARRRPAFAQTQPDIFRSECFAEDLVDAASTAAAPVRIACRPGAPR